MTYVEDAVPGCELPPLVLTVGEVQMFFFSAAAYNGHRIHYDHGWATQTEGYPGLVVQGYLQEALLARTVTDWIGSHGRLVEFATQNRGAAYAGQRLTFGGRVTAVRDQHLADLELSGTNEDGDLLMPGTATVWLPSRGGSSA